MRNFTMTFACAGIAALLLPAGALAGGSLTRADFERCNQQAMQVAGIADSQSPAASPGMSTPGTSGSMSSPSTTGSGSSSMPSSSTTGSGTTGSGSMSGSSGTTGSGISGSGSTSGAGSSATTSSADQEKIDRAVQAFRDCLQGK